MPTVVPVRFAYATRDLWFDSAGLEIAEADHLICSTERGTEIGLATGDPREVTYEELRRMCGDATLKPVLRIADDNDLDRAELQAERGERALPTFRRLVSASGLDMKPVGVEYLFGGEKVVCYFSAEERVDFRQLVRQLASELHERIDMRQIGVREEAAHVGGFAHCGQELCCARFGHQFEPVSIRMAKEQDLPLNSTKISGACGRLMCCLRYEFEAYRDFKSRAPKKNAVIETPLGKAKIMEYDTPKEQIALRLENGKLVRVALADMVASEAAVKKSQEFNCPCRPDTVTREALERLASPEVQMALAELDREMGVVDESFDDSDLFVEAKPKTKSRRRRSRRGGAEQAAVEGSPQAETPRAEEQKDNAQAGQASGAGSGRSRRRRRKHTAEGGAPEAPETKAEHTQAKAEGELAGEGATATRSRRRRHRSGAGKGAEDVQQQGRSEGSQPTDGNAAPKRRRRPGDKGGQQAQPQAHKQEQGPSRRSGDKGGQQAQQQEQSPSRRPGDQGGAKAGAKTGAQQESSNGEGQAPRRRRRRRGGRGRGGQGNTDAGGSSQGPVGE